MEEVEEEEESPGELNALPRMAELRQGGTECNPQHHPAERERGLDIGANTFTW